MKAFLKQILIKLGLAVADVASEKLTDAGKSGKNSR